MAELLDYTGKCVVVTGAASGMGAATCKLLLSRGAEVHALDITPIEWPAPSDTSDKAASYECDLGDRESIDAAVSQLPAKVDSLLNCAGVPNGGRFSPHQVMAVNWLGLRHLTESVLPRIGAGGAIVHIASTAGRDWAQRVELHRQLMAATSFEAGATLLEGHLDVVGDGYSFSKETVQYYTMWRAVQLLPTGVRMNSVCPGVTDTTIVADFRRGLGDEVIDHAAAVAGRMAEPSEMAPAMLFLADHASSSYVNGVNLVIDRGTGAARQTDQSDPELIWGSRSSLPK